MSGIHVKFEVSPSQFLSDLAQATYKVALKHGVKDSFLEVELELYEAIQAVLNKDMMFSPACGEPACRLLPHLDLNEPQSGNPIPKLEDDC